MKLNHILKIFTENNHKLELHSESKTESAQSFYIFQKLNQYREAIRAIEATGLMANEISKLRETPIFSTFQDSLKIASNEGSKIISLNNTIRIISSGILESLQNITVPPRENSITIKLPNDISDLESLARVSADLQMILNQTIVNEQIKGEIKIQAVENGSIWIEIYVGTSTALSLIASLSWSAMVIYKKLLEVKIMRQQVESLRIKNESLKEIQQAQKEQLDLLIEAEAKNIYQEHFDKTDPEQILRLKYSIKLLSELIDRGAEIHPALNTPEPVANLFPDKANLPMIESKINQIENHP